jgi:alpha/beta superfamily hydrolase
MTADLSAAPDTFPAMPTTFLLPGPAGALECASMAPAPELARAGAAIICHPHPLQGGTMTNKVVTTLERALHELGLATVRFNFRGVGASQGVYDHGQGETGDALAVAAWLARVRPRDALWLAGFSFGCYVALNAANRLPVKQLITVAPAVTRLDFAALQVPDCPWLVIQGEADEVVEPAAVYAYVAIHDPAPTLVRVPEAGHFFHRRLIELRALVQDNVRGNLPALATPA